MIFIVHENWKIKRRRHCGDVYRYRFTLRPEQLTKYFVEVKGGYPFTGRSPMIFYIVGRSMVILPFTVSCILYLIQ